MASPLYGFVAALVSCVTFGSFAVPIKGEAANSVSIDPLVMQTYKTGMCFLTSWLVLLLGGPFVFTPWGLLSGLFWVPGGTAGIAAVRTAGLAVSQGTWSTLKIMVAFVWGILVFDEHVRSRTHAAMAIVLMVVGLWGMSYYSSPQRDINVDARYVEQQQELDADSLAESLLSNGHNYDGELDESENVVDECAVDEQSVGVSSNEPKWVHRFSRRQIGLVCAVFDGVWGGSILVPMHFARSSAEGLGYVISFAIGATMVLMLMWTLRFAILVVRKKSLFDAWNQLPGLHFRVMWLPGGLAGLLWSVGNIASMLSVVNLGEGVGYSIVQAQMLVAGLWGMFWFREVKGWRQMVSWLSCACVTVAGILFLSNEHIKS